MEWYWVLALLLGSILFLMFVGVPVGFSFVIVCTVAAFFSLVKPSPCFGRVALLEERPRVPFFLDSLAWPSA